MYNNRVDLKGNLTREPEYKDIKGTKLLTFRLAVNESIGKDKEETTYIDVEAWRNHSDYAESVGLKKGDRVHVVGRLKPNSWTDKETGANREKLSVAASTFSKVYKPASRPASSSTTATATADDQVTFQRTMTNYFSIKSKILNVDARIQILQERSYRPDITLSESKEIDKRKKKLVKTKEKLLKKLEQLKFNPKYDL